MQSHKLTGKLMLRIVQLADRGLPGVSLLQHWHNSLCSSADKATKPRLAMVCTVGQMNQCAAQIRQSQQGRPVLYPVGRLLGTSANGDQKGASIERDLNWEDAVSEAIENADPKIANFPNLQYKAKPSCNVTKPSRCC